MLQFLVHKNNNRRSIDNDPLIILTILLPIYVMILLLLLTMAGLIGKKPTNQQLPLRVTHHQHQHHHHFMIPSTAGWQGPVIERIARVMVVIKGIQ